MVRKEPSQRHSDVSTKTRATIEDLSTVESKVELVNGEIAEMRPAGADSGAAGFQIAVSSE